MPENTQTYARPYDDPEYGMKDDGHQIASQPRWSLEENQNWVTGWAGATVVFSGGALFAAYTSTPQMPDFLVKILPFKAALALNELISLVWEWRGQFVLLMVFFAMFLVETLVFKVHRRHFDFTQGRSLDVRAVKRIVGRWAAVCFCLGLGWFLYVALGEYAFNQFEVGKVFFEGVSTQNMPYHFYAKYILFFTVAVPAIAVFCIPYFWMVERYARDDGPIDEFLILARCLYNAILGLVAPYRKGAFKAAVSNKHVHNLMRGLGVKFFFIPLMMIWCVNSWNNWEHDAHYILYEMPVFVWSDPHQVAYLFRYIHHGFFNMIITMDLTIALIGYIASARLLDTQVTSAEPTLLGWMVALLCYPPTNMQLTAIYLNFGTSLQWEYTLIDSPILSILVSLAVLFLMGVYAWGTIAFGMRFSNLTNRGIVCTGPYAYVRHPAYITKGSSWWFESLPFIHSWPAGFINVLHLLSWNIIYGLRAWTEERHLMREPHYRDYCKKVKWRFIPGIF